MHRTRPEWERIASSITGGMHAPGVVPKVGVKGRPRSSRGAVGTAAEAGTEVAAAPVLPFRRRDPPRGEGETPVGWRYVERDYTHHPAAAQHFSRPPGITDHRVPLPRAPGLPGRWQRTGTPEPHTCHKPDRRPDRVGTPAVPCSGPSLACLAAGVAEDFSSGLMPSVDSRSCCSDADL